VPLYEYQCDACGERFEVIRKFSDPPLEVCARCGKGPIERLQSSPAIQFKGAGWYITDYAKKAPAAEGGSDKTDSATKTESGDKGDKAGTKGTDTPSTPTKSDAPAPSTPATPATNKS
jgi:putative FmdB family regulatory protein